MQRGGRIHVAVPRVPFQKLSSDRGGEPLATIQALVEAARARQTTQFVQEASASSRSTRPAIGLTCNADMGPTQVRDCCQIDETSRQLFGIAMWQMNLNARARLWRSHPQARPHHRRSGGQRPHPDGAHRGGDLVSAAADGVTRGKLPGGNAIHSSRRGRRSYGLNRPISYPARRMAAFRVGAVLKRSVRKSKRAKT
jgi:hypothetical protein